VTDPQTVDDHLKSLERRAVHNPAPSSFHFIGDSPLHSAISARPRSLISSLVSMDSASPSPKQSDRKRPASPLAAPSPAKSSKPTPSPGKPSKKAAVGRGESWTKDDVLKLYNLINPRKVSGRGSFPSLFVPI
jgi:hypothetical protein